LGLLELLPVLSYFWLKGRCKHCHALIAWHYPVVEAFTALSFVVIVRIFGVGWYGLGMLFFASTLIAVCITDFKEKLIPHDITYPALLLGIVFSVNIRHDFWGTMAGIAISYIFFDFLAHYALKVYLWFERPDFAGQHKQLLSCDPAGQTVNLTKWQPPRSLLRSFSHDPKIQTLAFTARQGPSLESGEPVEEFEVIGGGDAVLSALIAAWLGLNRLILALLIGFLVGTVMGAAYLLYEMYKQRMLKSIVFPVSIGAVSLAVFVGSILAAIAHLTRQPIQAMTWYIFLPIAALCGGLFGIILAGRRASKPYPFGPALAIGAAIAALQQPMTEFGSGTGM
jgi:prepilin signal peptidase PulO-like enzyme (type II secretory pathway)